MNRKSFILGSASCAAFSCNASFWGKSDKVRLAAVGVMGKGFSDWFPMVKSGKAELVALCDCDVSVIEKAQARLAKDGYRTLELSRIPFYTDYRRLLDDARKLGIDAMTVSTPNHTHAPVAIPAMKQGINCFVQMPLVRTLWELDYFGKTARNNKVTIQMGNQGSSLDSFRRNVEILTSGILGNVSEVHMWTNRPVWPQGKAVMDWIRSHPNGDAIRRGLDWNAWLASASDRPFLDTYPANAGVHDLWGLGKNVYHTFAWRGLRDFGIGALEMACHMMNLPFRGLELCNVTDVECTHTCERNDVSFPMSSSVRWTFADRESRIRPGIRLPEVKMYWYDGQQVPNIERTEELISAFGRMPSTGCVICGSKGDMMCVDDYGAKCYIVLSGDKFAQDSLKHPACVVIPRRIQFRTQNSGFACSHYEEFLDAILGNGPLYYETRSRCYSNIGHSIPLVEAILTGVVAQQVHGKLKWDSKSQRFDSSEANMLMRPYIRKGFEF